MTCLISQDDANPFVVDVRKVIRILLLEMAVLPLELLGLTFQVCPERHLGC